MVGTTTQSNESIYATMLASAVSGMSVRIPLHPLDTCKAKLQVQRPIAGDLQPLPRFHNVLSCVRYTYHHEGLRGLYAGFPIAFLGSAPASCLYLTSYELNKRMLEKAPVLRTAEPLRDFCSGLLAECFSCIIWVPVDVVKERLQVQSNIAQMQRAADKASPTPPRPVLHYKSTLHAITTIARTEGIKGIYRGYGATIASFGPYSAFYLSGYDQLKKLCVKLTGTSDVQHLPFYCYLLSGGAAGGLAALITNPLDMAKLRLQVQRGQSGLHFGYRNLFHGMGQIVKHEGMKALFKGAGARIAFFAPSAALNIAIFDTLKNYFNSLLENR